MSSEQNLHHHVSKFDGLNTQLWKYQIQNVLIANDLLDVVDSTRTKPVADSYKPNDKKNEIRKFIKDDARAKVLIIGTMTDKQAGKFLACETANAIWLKFAFLYEQKSETSKLSLLHKFNGLVMSPSESVGDYITRVPNVARNLADIKEKVSEPMLMAKILGGLPRKFDSLVVAWDSVASDKQTMENLEEQLMREESRVAQKEEEVTALYTSRGKGAKRCHDKSNKENDDTSKKRCYRCKETSQGTVVKRRRERKRREKKV